MRYCQRCGSETQVEVIEGRERDICSVCGNIYYNQWKVSAGVRVVSDGKVLLVQRGLEPWRGKWHMPAGYVEIDEEPWQAAEREAREETGLTVRVNRLVNCYTDTCDPRGNVIVLIYDATVVSGNLALSSETQSVNFFSPHEISSLPLAGKSAEDEISDWLREVEK